MGESVDPKKILVPFLQRADELQKHEPLVAYYCRLYAMERGLKIPAKERGKIVNSLLVSLMTQLEKDKKVISASPDDSMYLEGFALNVFAKADKQDRTGRADLNTAKTFYAASLFFEILHQFGEIPPDIEQKQKYAVWKAADIRKAISEGRKPTPGPPGGDDETIEWDQIAGSLEEPQKRKISPAGSGFDAPDKGPESLPSQTHGSKDSFRPDPPTHPSSFDSLPNPPTLSPRGSGPPHNRTGSWDDIDLPSAPSDPVHPVSPPRHISGLNANYPPAHLTGRDSSAPPPPIHDWSGSRSQISDRSRTETFSSENAAYPPGPYITSVHPTAHDNGLSQPSAPTSGTADYPPGPYITSLPPPGQESGYSQQSAPTSGYGDYPPGPYVTSTSPAPENGFSQQSGYAAYPPGPYITSAPSYTAYPTSASTTPHSPAAPTAHHRTASAPSVPQSATTYSTASPVSASSFQPTPDKVAEAHKAARFAVSALAFDDVPTAIEYLRKSLDLLTSPSSQTN